MRKRAEGGMCLVTVIYQPKNKLSQGPDSILSHTIAQQTWQVWLSKPLLYYTLIPAIKSQKGGGGGGEWGDARERRGKKRRERRDGKAKRNGDSKQIF